MVIQEYLSRGDAPFSDELWNKIDTTVTQSAKENLVGRRFLSLYGPLGGAPSVARIDGVHKEETFEDGFSVMQDRQLVQIPQIYEDFWVYWRDLEYAKQDNIPLDLSAAAGAAQVLANREDQMVFYGVPKLGIKGLLTADGVNAQKKNDWSAGENAFVDIAQAVTTLRQKGRVGRYTVVVSVDVYLQLQRITPGSGVLESERIEKAVGGRLFASNVLEKGTAAVVCAQPQYMDLLVGQDIRTAYTEAVDLNHHLRVLETALVRVKSPDAIVVLK